MPEAARFPFRAVDDADAPRAAAAIAAAVDDVTPMVHAIVRLRGRGLEFDDATQDVMLWLIRVSLPRYDATRGELRPYAARCIYRRLKELRDAECRRRRREQGVATVEVTVHIDHARVRQLAAAIASQPEEFLSAAQAKAVRAVQDNPTMSRPELARHLGRSLSWLNHAIASARRAVASIAREQFA